jgi:hypothetical protein
MKGVKHSKVLRHLGVWIPSFVMFNVPQPKYVCSVALICLAKCEILDRQENIISHALL